MARKIDINRDEAELLVDLLDNSDSHLAIPLSNYIRAEFGMVSFELQKAFEKELSPKMSPRDQH